MPDQGQMTAAEGADRVAARYEARKHERRSIQVEAVVDPKDTGNEDGETTTPKYTCENCSGHVFLFIRTVDQQRAVREKLNCSCDQADEAAVRELLLTQTVSETARLDEGHRPSAEDEEYAETNVEDEGSEQTDLDVSCQRWPRRS